MKDHYVDVACRAPSLRRDSSPPGHDSDSMVHTTIIACRNHWLGNDLMVKRCDFGMGLISASGESRVASSRGASSETDQGWLCRVLALAHAGFASRHRRGLSVRGHPGRRPGAKRRLQRRAAGHR